MNESLPGAVEGHFTRAEEHDPETEQGSDAANKHPLWIWTGLDSGDVVSLRAFGNREYVGIVEQKTSDGLVIWIRDNLNERKIFHYHDCQSVILIERR